MILPSVCPSRACIAFFSKLRNTCDSWFASPSVSIESGVDFEKRIASIYQTCKTAEEIQQEFDQLQEELSEEI